MTVNDQLQKFMFDAAPVRGEIVSLRSTWQEVLARRAYPAAVRSVLGEMMAACALLAANLKFDSTFIMQIFGDGPVNLLVVQCGPNLAMRATAHLADGAMIDDEATLAELVNVSGRGRCAITLDPGDKRPGQQSYQGIVPLADQDGPLPSIAAVLEHYMHHSEQLDTRLWLAAKDEGAAGMLLQKLPDDGGGDSNSASQPERDAHAWERVCALGNTLTRDELLEQEPQALLGKLFWQEDVRLFAPLAAHFHCSCSRQKVGAMLYMLGRDEVNSVLAEQGRIEIHCDYCNQRYEFDAVDVAQLFLANGLPHGIASAKQSHHH